MATCRKMPTTRNEVAAAGLQSAINLVVLNSRLNEKEAIAHMVHYLNCNAHQFHRYVKCEGLPAHYVDAVLNFLKARDIPFGRHQLKPTRAVLSSYGIGSHHEVNQNA